MQIKNCQTCHLQTSIIHKGRFTLWPLGREAKYTNCGVCISLERKVVFSWRIWISINIVDKIPSIEQTLGAKIYKNCYHVDILEGVILWLLAFGMKAQ
jgi:hypothetical protein